MKDRLANCPNLKVSGKRFFPTRLCLDTGLGLTDRKGNIVRAARIRCRHRGITTQDCKYNYTLHKILPAQKLPSKPHF